MADSGSTTITINEPIADYNLSVTSTNKLAGQEFELKVTNAVDAYGRPVDGIVEVTFQDGG